MCCGSKRLDAARNAAAAYAQTTQTAPRAPRNPAYPGAIPDSPGAAGGAAAAAAMAAAGPVFVHDGPGELVVTGRHTGRRYRFTGRGARLAVDLQDAPALALVDRLRRIA